MGHRSTGDPKIVTYCIALVLLAIAFAIMCVAWKIVSPVSNTCEQSGSIAGPSGSSASVKITYNCDNSHDEGRQKDGPTTPPTVTTTATEPGGESRPPTRTRARSDSPTQDSAPQPVITVQVPQDAPPSSTMACPPASGRKNDRVPPRSSRAPKSEASTTAARPTDVTIPSTYDSSTSASR
jgi:cytoskeletal protein RodZ